MRRYSPLLGLLVLVLACGSDSPRGYSDAATADPLHGKWRVVSVEVDGRRLPPHWFSGTLLVIRGGQFFWMMDGHTLSCQSYRFDARGQPARLDRTERDDVFQTTETWREICQVEGDRLRIARGVKPGDRPASFSDSGIAVMTLERVKE